MNLIKLIFAYRYSVHMDFHPLYRRMIGKQPSSRLWTAMMYPFFFLGSIAFFWAIKLFVENMREKKQPTSTNDISRSSELLLSLIMWSVVALITIAILKSCSK